MRLESISMCLAPLVRRRQRRHKVKILKKARKLASRRERRIGTAEIVAALHEGRRERLDLIAERAAARRRLGG